MSLWLLSEYGVYRGLGSIRSIKDGWWERKESEAWLIERKEQHPKYDLELLRFRSSGNKQVSLPRSHRFDPGSEDPNNRRQTITTNEWSCKRSGIKGRLQRRKRRIVWCTVRDSCLTNCNAIEGWSSMVCKPTRNEEEREENEKGQRNNSWWKVGLNTLERMFLVGVEPTLRPREHTSPNRLEEVSRTLRIV